MFDKIGSFMKRHGKKIAALAGLVFGLYVFGSTNYEAGYSDAIKDIVKKNDILRF